MSDTDSKPKLPRVKQRPYPPSREQMILLGEQASALLQSPVFNAAVRTAIDSWLDQILQSSPEDSAKRENLYQRGRALNDVLIELPGYIRAAQAMTEEERNHESAASEAWVGHLSGYQ